MKYKNYPPNPQAINPKAKIMFGGVVLSSNFTTMKEQEPYKAFKDKEATESVKIKKSLLNKLRTNKLKTGVNITAFVEQAITDKLKTNKQH